MPTETVELTYDGLPITATHENIQGLESNTEYTNFNNHFPERDVTSTLSIATDAATGNSVTVMSWWDNGSVIQSTVIIQEPAQGSFDTYTSDFGSPVELVVIGSGGSILPIEEFDLQQ